MNVETIVAQISGEESITGKIELEGLKGDKGTTFIPNVNENGDLSWSNDGGLENPQTVNIRGPRGERGIQGERGDKGESGMPGPSNSLTIGTVTKGDTAGATITGISPNQILNLVLPKGDKGDTGATGPVGTTDYNDLINKPVIPSKLSDLTNDSNFATEAYVTNAISTAIGSALGGSY